MNDDLSRSAGILLHISSLPGSRGMGSLGPEAYRFVDFLHLSGQKLWQVLPLGPVYPHFGFSPYASPSTFAGNEFFISFETLVKDGWLRKGEAFPVDAGGLSLYSESGQRDWRKWMQTASIRFFRDNRGREDYEIFLEENNFWLEDYALFMAIAAHLGNCHWIDWPSDLASRNPIALKTVSKKYLEEIQLTRFCQFQFYRQWSGLQKYCHERGIVLIGDMPFYVTLDGADAWAKPEIFSLDRRTNHPVSVAGVPPDYFSEEGQLWGNPLFRWFDPEGQLNESTYQWWRLRVGHALNRVGMLRIDHFRGFESYWSIPGDSDTARTGQWVKGPGDMFFQRLLSDIPDCRLLAEDLGMITPEVEQLRDRFGFPGMKILQFAFDGNPANPYLPHNFHHDRWAVYTGTHDNNTVMGWFFGSEIDDEVRQRVLEYLGIDQPEMIQRHLIELAYRSLARFAVIPMQDFLGLGEEARMNRPGSPDGNWRWQCAAKDLNAEMGADLKHLTKKYDRI